MTVLMYFILYGCIVPVSSSEIAEITITHPAISFFCLQHMYRCL